MLNVNHKADIDMVNRIKLYFDLQELVCKHVYEKFGESAWTFFDERLLDTLYVIRTKLNKPIYVNNWQIGGNLSQRGLRCNCCILVKEKTALEKVYMSTHMQGNGIDFDVKGMTAQKVREWIVKNQILLPYSVRLEADVNWVHLDLRTDGKQGKVTFFHA